MSFMLAGVECTTHTTVHFTTDGFVRTVGKTIGIRNGNDWVSILALILPLTPPTHQPTCLILPCLVLTPMSMDGERTERAGLPGTGEDMNH